LYKEEGCGVCSDDAHGLELGEREREREREFEEAGGGRARCLLEQERREIVTGRAWGETVMEVERI
jgi:hypothetical protein